MGSKREGKKFKQETGRTFTMVNNKIETDRAEKIKPLNPDSILDTNQ